MSYPYTVRDRFMRYVRIDTQSDPESIHTPSTEKQKELSRLLVEEAMAIGLSQVEMDEFGYVYATIPSNSQKSVPTIFFCAHVDTAPDASGTGVKPLLHKNYQGGSIHLPDDKDIVITEEAYPNLKKKYGHDIITASGKTLLGADDKAGVAIIMDAANYLMQHPEISHGEIRLLFTPDEEIGRGVAKVNMDKLKAAFGYTLDSGELGHFEYENFSADAVSIKIRGVSSHPGYAKGKMENAIKIGSEIVARLPKFVLSPETTHEKQGFIHPVKMEGELENATLLFIIRDFTTARLAEHEAVLRGIMDEVLRDYPHSSADFEVKEQYRNMKDQLEKNPHVIDYAIEAINRAGIDPVVGSIRGGTDGAMLSHMGVPTPNLFAGQQGIHSKYEWVSVQDMEKAVDTVVNICQITEEKA